MEFRYLIFLWLALFVSCKKGDDKQKQVFSIAGFSPKNAMIGDTLIITGQTFGVNPEAIHIQVGNSAPVKPLTIKESEMTVIIPEDASGGKIKLTKSDGSFVLSTSDFFLDDLAYDKISFSRSIEFSVARAQFGAAGLKGKIVFAGGEATGDYTTAEIFDVKTGALNLVPLTSPSRYELAAAAAGTKIVFAGGMEKNGISKAVDIYDVVTSKWSVAQLSEPRYRLAAAAAGNKIIFAGGASPSPDGPGGEESKKVDIYDVSTGQWSTAELSVARRRLTATAAGSKILIGGGYDENGDPVRTVDIYDVNTGKWTTAQLSMGRDHFAAAGAGNIAIFAGGSNANDDVVETADIFNAANGTWTTAKLSAARSDLAGAAFPNKIVFAGGYDNNDKESKIVDIYNIKTGTWTTAQLSVARGNLAGAASGNALLFAGGFSMDQESKRIDIFTLSK
ncbi:kelch repeat-containing protein [Arcticibacter sp. MXS-1]|uniref:Kelch repeat-containing protein n=1 Tax=Arcticibacter sp. MXS-1 TaxID=3341726 RepID=UPI0035A8EBD1